MLNPKAAREGTMTYTQQPAEPPSFLVAVTWSAVWPTTSSSFAAIGKISVLKLYWSKKPGMTRDG